MWLRSSAQGTTKQVKKPPTEQQPKQTKPGSKLSREIDNLNNIHMRDFDAINIASVVERNFKTLDLNSNRTATDHLGPNKSTFIQNARLRDARTPQSRN